MLSLLFSLPPYIVIYFLHKNDLSLLIMIFRHKVMILQLKQDLVAEYYNVYNGFSTVFNDGILKCDNLSILNHG